MMADKYKKVGGGSYGVYKKQGKSIGEIIGDILGGVFFVFIVLAIIGALFG